MKTIKKWFNDLTEEERKLAIENTDEDVFEVKTESLISALLGAFHWEPTEEKGQGYDFWDKIYHKYERQNRND